MSVTFGVFPLKKQIPTFRAALDLSTEKLNRFLKDQKINFDARIEVKLLAKENNVEQKVNLDSSAKWGDDFYAWFTVSTFTGGADSYYWKLNDEDKADNLEELLSGDLEGSRRNLIEACLENRILWLFRKSAGQLCITAIAYGFVASSFAELTEGVIFSGDGGWDYQIFPATAEEFDNRYFRPEKAISEDRRKSVKDCMENLPFELRIYDSSKKNEQLGR